MHVSRIRGQADQAMRAAGRVLRRGSPRSAPARALAAVVLAAALAGSVLAMARPDRHLAHPPGRMPAVPAAASATAASQPGLRPVTLVTGQQVRLTQTSGVSVVSPAAAGQPSQPGQPGRPAASSPATPKARTASSPPSSGVVTSFDVAGDTYAVPAAALPYLGSRLDPRLFDISYLQRAGYTGLKALPLSITWQHQDHAAIPGITAPASGLRTTGSVAFGNAGQFGQAIQASARGAFGRQPAVATRTGSTPAAGAFAQVKKITLAPLRPAQAASAGPALPGLPAGLPAAPAAPLAASTAAAGTKVYSVTLHALDRSGQPGFALVTIQNLDNLQRYYSISAVTPDAPLQVSLPAGRYAIDAIIYDKFLAVEPESIAFVPVPEVTVSRDTSLTLDARQAKPATVQVPRTVATEEAGITFARSSADGAQLTAIVFAIGPAVSSVLPPLRLYAKPTPAPKVGALGFADSWELQPPGTGAGGVNIPYTYSLDFASARGVPATLSHTLTASDLATVHASFDSSAAGEGGFFEAAPYQSWSPLALGLDSVAGSPFPVPARQTQYVGGTPSTVWATVFEPIPASGDTASDIFGPYQKFRPGEQASVTWGATPSVPAPEWQDTGIAHWTDALTGGSIKPTLAYECPVCRQGDVMSFDVVGSGDNDTRHTESRMGVGAGPFNFIPGLPSSELKFYRNGVLTQVSRLSGQVFPLLPGKASYKIEWASTIPADLTQLATAEDSTWTFTSARAKPDKLPSYELCSPDVSNAACSYLPLVFARYDFGASQSGQVSAPGAETFTVTGYHEKGDAGPAVNRASVQVSFDDGTTWAPAASVAPLGGGQFKVTIQQPDPSATTGYASIRIHLADAAGDALDQTILRAYALTGK